MIRNLIDTLKMLAASLVLLALAATGLAQVPEGYRAVYITSNVNPKFVVVPKARTSGSTTIVYVSSGSHHHNLIKRSQRC